MVIDMIIGSILGFLSGLGTGGGSLLLLWLTIVQGVAPAEARTINLMFFVPSAVIACWLRRRQGQLDIKKALPAIIAGSIVSGICTFFSQGIPLPLIQKLFGVLLLFTGARELLYKPKEP